MISRHPKGSSSPYNDLMENLNILFYSIFNAILKHFVAVVCPHLTSIFTKPVNMRVKRLHPSFPRYRLPIITEHLLIPDYVKELPWDLSDIQSFISELLITFWRFSLPSSLIRSLFASFLSSLNSFLFNQLLTTEELCTAANGFQIKLTLSLFEEWLSAKDIKTYIENPSELLKKLAEAATLLTLHKQLLASDSSAISLVCPSLSPEQVDQLITHSRSDTSLGQPPSTTLFDWLRKVVGSEVNAELLERTDVDADLIVSEVYSHWT